MLLEIRGCSRRNKGAELMLIAIQQHFKALNPSIRFAVDQWFGGYEDRAFYGLWVRPALKRKGRGSISLQLMPSSLKRNLGIVESVEIDATLDAAGFAYGDIHGPEPTEALATAIESFKHGKPARPFILLPQAFGPFTSHRIRGAMRRVADGADLIYARDRQSLDALTQLCGERTTIRMAPDFTAALTGDRAGARDGKVLVIPNARMLDKTDASVAQGYVPFLVELINHLRSRGLQPEILLHDREEDAGMARQINAQLAEPLAVVSAEDPLRLKGLIAGSRLVIGSRFHALVGALSQGVPAVGIGWSHKYQELFAEHGCAECLLPVAAEQNRIEAAFKRTLEEAEPLQRLFSERVEKQRAQILEMWGAVDKCLGLPATQTRSGFLSQSLAEADLRIPG